MHDQDYAQAPLKKRKLSTCQRISDAAASLVPSAPLFSANTPSRQIIDKVKNAKERAARTLRRMSTAIGLGGRTANPAQSPKEEPWVSSEPPYDFSSSPTAYSIRNYPLALPVPKETKPLPHCPNEILSMIAVFANQWNMAEVCKNWKKVVDGIYPNLRKAYKAHPILCRFVFDHERCSSDPKTIIKGVYKLVLETIRRNSDYPNTNLRFRLITDKTSLAQGLRDASTVNLFLLGNNEHPSYKLYREILFNKGSVSLSDWSDSLRKWIQLPQASEAISSYIAKLGGQINPTC